MAVAVEGKNNIYFQRFVEIFSSSAAANATAIREALLCMQGISGAYLQLEGSCFSQLQPSAAPFLCPDICAFLGQICLIGNAYLSISNFLQKQGCAGNGNSDVLQQQFCSAVESVKHAYLHFVCDQQARHKIEAATPLAVLNCSRPWARKLKLICSIIDRLQEGGLLLECLHASLYQSIGSEGERLALDLFCGTLRDYFCHFLRNWLANGSLPEVGGDFFIGQQVVAVLSKADWWESTFQLVLPKIPPFISRTTAEKVLSCVCLLIAARC